MKKGLIGFLVFVFILAGVCIWQGENIVNAIFYDMDATMDLPENLFDDDSLNSVAQNAQKKENIYLADVNDFLSLREEPKRGSRVLAEIKPQTEMELLDSTTSPYVKVYVPIMELEGYVHEDYIVKKD